MYPQTAWCSSESTLICLAVMIVGGHYHLLLSLHNIIIRPLVTPVYSIQIIFSCIHLSLDFQEMSFPGHSRLLRKAQISLPHIHTQQVMNGSLQVTTPMQRSRRRRKSKCKLNGCQIVIRIIQIHPPPHPCICQRILSSAVLFGRQTSQEPFLPPPHTRSSNYRVPNLFYTVSNPSRR